MSLTNEHYTIRCNEGRDKINGFVFYKPVEKHNIISVKFNNDNSINCYDGKKSYNISYEEYITLIQDNNKIRLKCYGDEDIINKRNDYIIIADELLNKTKNTKFEINLYKYKSIPNCSMDLFRMLSKKINTIENITVDESIRIDRANHGGHHYSERYEGDAIAFDVNSMYLYYMSSNEFTFPINQGEFKYMTNKEFQELKFYQYGLYRCNITYKENKLFHPFKNNEYTHYDLTLAKQLNFEINIIENDGSNILLYEHNRVNGNIAFEDFKNLLYPLKQQNIKGAKLLINSLWGSMCDKNHTRRKADNNNIVEIEEGGFIEEIHTNNDEENTTFVKYSNINQIFRNNEARIGCFLTSFCRLQFCRMVKPYYDRIIRINTDSMLLKGLEIPQDIKISDEIGAFKIEYKGYIKYHVLNRKPIIITKI